jgi:hypothetical protein
VTVRINDGGGSNDTLLVYDSSNSFALAMGSVDLGRTDYVTTSRTFTSSTMVLSGSTVTVTLGTASGAVGTAASTGTMTWTPSGLATDRASNMCSTAATTETGAADKEF